MREFLRDYWPWFVAPLVIAALAIAAWIALGGGEELAPGVYTIR